MIRRLLPTTNALPAPPLVGFVLVAAGVAAYAALLAVGATAAHDWLAPALYGAIAVLVGARAATVERDRTAWALLSAGLAAYGLGSLIYVAAGGATLAEAPWPAHAAWLTFYPLAYAAVVVLVRARVPALASSLALDGALGAFTLAAVATALFTGARTVESIDEVSGVAYLQGDVLLIAVLLWSALLGGRGGKRMWLTLAAGLTIVCASDLWAATTAAGEIAGRLSRAAYPAGMLAAAVAAWQAPAPRRRVRADSLSALALPSVCVAALLVLLVVDRITGDVPGVALTLTVIALALAAVRAVLSYQQLARFREGRRFQRGFEDATIGMALLSTGDVRWLKVNAALCRMLGRTEEEMIGRRVTEFLAPDEQPDPQEIAAGMAGGAATAAFDRVFLHADGHTRVEAQVTTVLVDEEEDEPYFFSQVRDLTIRNRARRRSDALAELSRLALDVPDPDRLLPAALPVACTAVAGDACVVGTEATTRPPAAIGIPLRGRVDADGAPELLFVWRSSGAFDEDDLRFLRAAADLLSGALDRADAEREMRRRALEDPLTGLANRAFLLGHLEHELAATARGEGPLALLLLDVDRFKTINDTLGHNAGDDLLRQVAGRLIDRLRHGDVVARLGGDEFVVACGRLNGADEAALLAQRIVDAFAAPFDVEGRALHVDTSVGVAVAAVDAEATPGALLRDADTAMYRAKERGGGRFELFDAELRARVVKRLEVEHALRGAIDRGELRIELQPIVALDGEILSGFEALIRWEHPEWGRVPPCEFIPVAEDTDLIRPIGRWVIEQALAVSARLNADRPFERALRIGVNLSPRELVPDLVPFVRDAAVRAGADVRSLVCEITEGLLVQGEAARRVIADMRAAGVEMSLDDFGTGYSSLAAVDEYALDVVKLDRSLAAGLGESPRAEGLVRAAVGMTTALGVRVLAEGLEDERQVRAARALGCHFGQGWYWAPALPVAEAEALAAEFAGRALPAAAVRAAARAPSA